MQTSSSKWLWAAANTLALAFMLTLNALANALPINGLTTGEVAYSFPNLFIPAGFTFSIWGIIYLMLLAFVVYSWLAKASASLALLRRVSPWFVLSSLANGIWIIAWHHLLPGQALLLMLLLLASLVFAYRGMRTGAAQRADKWLVYLPFSIYLGWICIATIANVAALLTHLGWGGGALSPVRWTILAMGTGVLLSFFFLARYRDPLLPLVTIWALFGLRVSFLELPVEQGSVLAWTALLLLLSVGISLLGSWRRFHAYFQPSQGGG